LILYDKSGMFLGMGTQELSLLGYDDIEEFRNYHNDVADLFVNKAGYIFKFKNFSWIDYTLHSGTPNRRVLVKAKNGREIDSALHIYEIFLTQDLYGAKSCFGVEFVSASPFAKTEALRETPTSSETHFEPLQSLPMQEPTSFSMEDAPTLITPFEEEISPSEIEQSFEMPSVAQTEEPARDVGDFKLKFDSDILNEPSFIITPSTKESDTLFAQDMSLETYPEDAHEDLLQDTLLCINEPLNTLMEAEVHNVSLHPQETPFDFSLSAETLGLDISTLAEIITDYSEELDAKIPFIEKALESKDFLYAKEEIAKLKSVAYHLHIIDLYTHFEQLETQLATMTQASAPPSLLGIHTIISDLKESLRC